MDELRGPNIQIVLHVKEGIPIMQFPMRQYNALFARTSVLIIFCVSRTWVWIFTFPIYCKWISQWIYARDGPGSAFTCSYF